MLTAVNLEESREFKSQFDPERDANPTVFKLGLLDPFVRAMLDDEMTRLDFGPGGPDGQATTSVRLGTRNIEMVRFGLRGIENFKGPDGNPVQWRTMRKNVRGRSYEVPSDEVLRLIPPKIISELAGEIAKENSISDEERKN